MKKDEIIRMARAAGFGPAVEWAEMQPPFLRFAALVAAAEREACAQVCDAETEKAAQRFERFRDKHDEGCGFGAIACRDAIRARGGHV